MRSKAWKTAECMDSSTGQQWRQQFADATMLFTLQGPVPIAEMGLVKPVAKPFDAGVFGRHPWDDRVQLIRWLDDTVGIETTIEPPPVATAGIEAGGPVEAEIEPDISHGIEAEETKSGPKMPTRLSLFDSTRDRVICERGEGIRGANGIDVVTDEAKGLRCGWVQDMTPYPIHRQTMIAPDLQATPVQLGKPEVNCPVQMGGRLDRLRLAGIACIVGDEMDAVRQKPAHQADLPIHHLRLVEGNRHQDAACRNGMKDLGNIATYGATANQASRLYPVPGMFVSLGKRLEQPPGSK